LALALVEPEVGFEELEPPLILYRDIGLSWRIRLKLSFLLLGHFRILGHLGLAG